MKFKEYTHHLKNKVLYKVLKFEIDLQRGCSQKYFSELGLNCQYLHFQALRNRQNHEKEKFKELLEFKRRERLLKRRAAKHDKEEADGREVKEDGRDSRGSKDSGIDELGRGKADGGSAQRGSPEGAREDEDPDSDSELSVSCNLGQVFLVYS